MIDACNLLMCSVFSINRATSLLLDLQAIFFGMIWRHELVVNAVARQAETLSYGPGLKVTLAR